MPSLIWIYSVCPDLFVQIHVSRDMTKPTKWLCAQQRLRSAWASAQSDQSLLSAWRKLGLPIKCTVKILITLDGCPGWSESSLGAQSLCWFCHVAAQFEKQTESQLFWIIYWWYIQGQTIIHNLGLGIMVIVENRFNRQADQVHRIFLAGSEKSHPAQKPGIIFQSPEF